MKPKILYITYDGLTDALGQSQILSYLTGLSNHFEFFVLSFEKKGNFEKNSPKVAELVAANAIHWVKKWYTKKPPVVSTLYDVAVARRTAKRLHKQHRFAAVHCRGYVPALIGLYCKQQFNTPFIFDMRGWWADEKVESGSWAHAVFKPIYKYFKQKEKTFFTLADFSVSLTEAGKKQIVAQYGIAPEKIGVVPTCVNFSLFKAPDNTERNKLRQRLGINPSATVLVYSGALGGNYDLTILTTVFQRFNAQFENAFILILSKDEMAAAFSDTLQHAGISNFKIFNVPYREVSSYLCAADAGLIFYKPAFSNIGRNPTKLGEYWASGLPVIAMEGIGDLDQLQVQYPQGLVLLHNNLQNIDATLQALVFHNAQQLHGYAHDYCSLEKGVAFYQNLYTRLLQQG